MTCDFTYTDPLGEVTGVVYDQTTKKLTITGTNLPGLATTTSTTGGRRRRLAEEDEYVPGWDVKQIDRDILALHNEIRQNPNNFIPKLQAMLPKFDGLVYDGTKTTTEGAAAVQEAITFLQNQGIV